MARVARSPHLNLRIRRPTTNEPLPPGGPVWKIASIDLSGKCALGNIEGIAVDGTSGTLVALDAGNAPIGAASLYNDTCDDSAIVAAIAAAAPATSPALGATSALGRAIQLSRRGGVHRIVHQADWIALRLGHGDAIQTRTMP